MSTVNLFCFKCRTVTRQRILQRGVPFAWGVCRAYG